MPILGMFICRISFADLITCYSLLIDRDDSYRLNFIFSPFYRTEMLIIKPKNQSKWISHDGPFDDWILGPALKLEVLEEVLRLQRSIANLKGSIEESGDAKVSLEDICFTPLHPDNDNCTVFSILNYFQNSNKSLHRTKEGADYLSHIDICSR